MQSLKLKDTTINFEVSGKGPRVILIQGVGLGGCGWAPQVSELRSRYELASFDNRGISTPLAISPTLTIEQMADDTRALMDHLGWDTAHVVGHSMGGLIAQQLALSDRKRVRSLALLCTFSRGREGLGITPWRMWVGARSRIGTAKMRRSAFLEILLPPHELKNIDREAMAASLEPIFGHDLADQPDIAMRQLGAMARHNQFHRLTQLESIPTLVISGQYDRLALPKYGRRLAQQIPGSTFIELTNAAHGATISRAGEINTLLDTHFRNCGD